MSFDYDWEAGTRCEVGTWSGLPSQHRPEGVAKALAQEATKKKQAKANVVKSEGAVYEEAA